MAVIAMIPARGGSQRILKKNIRTFHGKPIIAYSIRAAQLSTIFDRVVVNTDDEEIGEVAAKYGAEVYFRAPRYGRNEVGTQEVMREYLETAGHADGYACCIYATSPLMDPEDLHFGYQLLQIEGGLTRYVFSVTTAGVCIADAGQWYWGEISAFINRQPLVGEYTRVFQTPGERVCDINTEEDWGRAEKLYADLHHFEVT